MELTGGGFEVPRTVLNLDFTGTDLDGLVVRAYVPPLGVLTGMLEMAGGLASVITSGQATLEQGRQALTVYDTFATYLKDWNVTSGGVPVPTTAEGLATLEVGFLNRLIATWQREVGQVPAPLAPSSPSAPSTDLSLIPMAPLPASPPSSPQPA